jgi:hypothetical protein
MSKGDGAVKTIVVTPAITAGVYHASDNIGGKMKLTDALRDDGGSALLVSLVVTDKANQKPVMQVVLFESDPSAATLTDNAAIVFSTDIAKVVAIIDVPSTSWYTVGSMGIATVGPLSKAVEAAAGSNNLWAAAMVAGTPTFAAVSDLTFKFGLRRY